MLAALPGSGSCSVAGLLHIIEDSHEQELWAVAHALCTCSTAGAVCCAALRAMTADQAHTAAQALS